jgi:hypothetical protein
MAVPGSNAGGGGQRSPGAVKSDLLDFLFTLALAIGLAPELIGGEGVLQYNWQLAIPSPTFLFEMSVFLLGLATLLFSWYGFNSSVSKNPVLYGSIAGLFRFSLDAFLVVLYGFLLTQFRNFEVFLLTLTGIFGIYMIWDALKIIEYRRGPYSQGFNGGRFSRWWHLTRHTWGRKSMKFFLGHVFTVAVYLGGLELGANPGIVSTVVLSLLIMMSVIYRASKVKWNLSADKEKIQQFEDRYSGL